MNAYFRRSLLVIFTALLLPVAAYTADAPKQDGGLRICRDGYALVVAKKYGEAIAPLRECVTFGNFKSVPQKAEANYILIVALFYSGAYNEAGRRINKDMPPLRSSLDEVLVAALDDMRSKLVPVTAWKSTVGTEFDPSFSKKGSTPKDLLKLKAAEEEAKKKKAQDKPKNPIEELNQQIASGATLGFGTEEIPQWSREVDGNETYELEAEGALDPAGVVLPSEWLRE